MPLPLPSLGRHGVCQMYNPDFAFQGPPVKHKQTPVKTKDSTGLTPVMRDTLYWLNKGYTEPETAEHMGINFKTFRGRIYKVYKALDVHSREEALIRARELGVIKDV